MLLLFTLTRNMNVFFCHCMLPYKNDTVDSDGCVCFAAVRLTEADAAAASHFVAYVLHTRAMIPQCFA